MAGAETGAERRSSHASQRERVGFFEGVVAAGSLLSGNNAPALCWEETQCRY